MDEPLPVGTRPGPSQRIDRLRIRHLKLLELVALTGSLTGAASALRVSQPNATKMLQELEHAFGCSLVDRAARGGSLSAAGICVLDRLKIATGALAAASIATTAAPQTPLVRIGQLPLAGVMLIPQLVATLSGRGMLPRLELKEGAVDEVLALLREGAVDCVIGRVVSADSVRGADMFDVLPLSDEGFELACAPTHPLARERKLDLGRLRDEAWAITRRGSYTRQVFDAAFISMGIPPPAPVLECASFHTNLATVAVSNLLSFAPRSAVQAYVTLGRIARLHLKRPFQVDYVVFITLRGVATLPAVQLVRQTLLEISRR